MLSDVNHAKNSKMAEIAEEYTSSLQELTGNSKPHINFLTLLAEDYIEYAPAIVEAVEAHLQKVQSALKLPVLYLIDSIIKNVNGVYLNLFANNIVQTFFNVFQKVDDNVRAKMWKLRQTWNDIFPAKKLLSLDVQVHSLDRNWPISSLPSNAVSSKSIIHVNPKFLSMQQKLPDKKAEEEEMRAELLKKSKLLEELKRQKSEMLQQKKKQVERPPKRMKSEMLASESSIEKPSVTIVPSNVSKLVKKEPKAPSEVSQAPTEQKPILKMMPNDPRRKTAAAIQNGTSIINFSTSASVEEKSQQQLEASTKCFDLASKSSLVSASPAKTREDNAPRSDSSQSTANADLSLIMNDNKSLDNDRIQRSSTSSQKSTSTVTGDAQPRDSSERSPSRSSLARGPSSSSSQSGKQQSSRSKSRSKSHGKTSSSSAGAAASSSSPAASSSSSSSPRKKSSKSRKRSRSPAGERHHHHQHHRHHHYHHSPKTPQPPAPPAVQQQQQPLSQGLDEEEQFGGSLIVSPPQPVANAFKEARRDSSSGSGARPRRSKQERSGSSSRSRSPEEAAAAAGKRRDAVASAGKDEDLRASLLVTTVSSGVIVAAAAAPPALDSKEDLDLRVLPPITTNKRKPTDAIELSAKKSKDETLDDLFGKEDVDLRLLAPAPKIVAVHPPTPPPPIISGDKEKDKDSWAKLKMPAKSESSVRSDPRTGAAERSERGRPFRPSSKIYNKSEEVAKERRRGGARDYERNSERNIEIIMKQAAEQLNQGTISKSQYNKLIQEVLHMSEDQKLRAAQRKERESKGWERGDKGMRPKEHGMLPRPPGPRWPQPWHQPWAHPPGPFPAHFRPEFRPIGPWQNHPRLFGSPLRPDFHQFHGGFNPRMGPPPMGPNGPILMPNGPLNAMSTGPMNPMGGPPMGPLPPGMMMNAGGPIMSKRPASSADSEGSWSNQSMDTAKSCDGAEEVSSSSNSDELPPADPAVLEEIAKDTMKSINIDNIPREVRYYGHNGIIFMHWDDPRDIGFQNGARRISIDGKEAVVCSFNDDYREFTYEGEVHKIKLGAPTRELYVDDQWYQCYFGGQPVTVELGNKKVTVKLEGPPPQVKIGTIKRTDLVVGKINLIINARCMVPVFLDAKPQMFNIDNKPCTLEFIDALQTVLLNGRPFKVEFGGLPKPVLVHGKKHFIRFSVLPRGFRAGYVKITGMQGEQPKELPAIEVSKKPQSEVSSSTSMAVPSPVEPDSTSQDGMDHSYTSKSDCQIDVLSSVVPSAMAPSSGLSYQAEPVENQPAPATTIKLPLSLDELYQRLVETGIVSNLIETKKPEEEEKKEPEIVPVSFDKPETLKIKQPAMVTSLYSGIQCSSCGARFAPEMATRYSHHLDWHFRQNRKERDSSRKAHSRLWYYDVSDWIQFEEIEDLEDRAQSWFETEKQNMETENAAAEELFDEALQPSVPTGSEEDACCQVCHEAFVQFYNDEKEEWHLRPAICFEGKNFHPLCLEDHKRIMEEPATLVESGEVNEENEEKPDDTIKKENEELKEKDENNENQAGESVKEEIIESVKEEMIEEKDAAESLIKELIENIVSEIDNAASDETTEESTQEANKETIEDIVMDQDSIPEVKEPSEECLQDTLVEIEVINDNVQTQEEPMDVEPEFEESTTESVEVDSTQVEVKSTIDGNVELDSSASIIPAAQSKIKINITKPLNSPKEPKENKEEKETIEEPEEENLEPLKPASIKPALCDRNLSVLPPVFKGEELSALCSIM